MKTAFLLALAVATPAAAALSSDDLARAVARPPADTRLPARLAFTDTTGRRITLGAIAGGRPLVLVFADYTCRHVCAPGLALTGAALEGTGLVPGRDYALAVIGLDPRDRRDDAVRMAARLGPLASHAHVMLGDAAATPATERALGYGVAYDAEADQWAHDASLYVFAADGRLAALLPELGAAPDALRAALHGEPVRASIADRIARLCYGLGAGHGAYGRAIALALQGGAALTLAGLALLVRRRRRPA